MGIMCTPKDQGGLGILDLELQNKCLLGNWLFKLINEDGMWQNVLRKKYLKYKTITQVEQMPGDSHLWFGLMKAKYDFLRLGKFNLGDGSQVRFWEDTWYNNIPFCELYPNLYNIVRKKSATVSKVLGSNPLNVAFRRSLVGNNLIAWHQLVATVMNTQLMDRRDIFRWSLSQDGRFTVSSMYKMLIAPNVTRHKHIIWKLKIPLKIKIFMWYLVKGVVLTKDNLAKQQWNGSLKCAFCDFDESINHLLFDCQMSRFIWRIVQISFNISPPKSINHIFNDRLFGVNKNLRNKILVGTCTLCWAIWLSRNDMVFNNARAVTVTTMQVIFKCTYWIRFWALLQKEEDKPHIMQGCRVLETTIMEVFAKKGWLFGNRLHNG